MYIYFSSLSLSLPPFIFSSLFPFHNILPFFLSLFQENMEGLYHHLRSNGVETHMYASQWFLTIYTAKFPLSMVFRVMDVYLCEVCA